jgi:hypothetical protein
MAVAVSRPTHRGNPGSVPASPCEICGEEIGNGTGFSPSTSDFPFSAIPPMLNTNLHLQVTRNKNG